MFKDLCIIPALFLCLHRLVHFCKMAADMFPLKLLPAFTVIKPASNIFVFTTKNHPIKALFKKDVLESKTSKCL